MNLKISSWAIRHPIPIIILFLLLTILSIRAFQTLPINADPDMRFPIVNITVRKRERRQMNCCNKCKKESHCH